MNVEFPITPDNLVASFRKALNWNRPFANRPEDTQVSGARDVAGMNSRELGMLLRPIATPLVMSGFEPAMADSIQRDGR